MNAVRVEYNASASIADPAALEGAVATRIENHFRTIGEAPACDVSLVVSIEHLEFDAKSGRLRIVVEGTVDKRNVSETILSSDRWSAREQIQTDSNRYIVRAFANCFSFLFRLLFPSQTSVAIGNRRTNHRILRAFDEAIADIRILIDKWIERPESGGGALWTRTKHRAMVGLFLTAAIGAGVYFARRHQVADQFRAIFGAALSAVSVYAIFTGIGIVSLPDQFYLSERAGRNLVKLAGVKSPRAIRSVGIGIVLLGACFLTAGLYWLCFE